MNETQIPYLKEEPIVAIATALVPSALGIVRVSGTNSIELLSKVFSRPEQLCNAKGNTIVYGWIQKEKKIDEVLINVYRAPKSFTGEDSAEIICHGGIKVVTAIFSLLLSSGFRQARGGEFSFRAFANGKTDLSKAEAIKEIIDAKTETAREKAANRLSGSLKTEITNIKEALVSVLAAIEVQLDYPEDEVAAGEYFDSELITKLESRLKQIASTWKTEKLYQDGAKIVLCGKTNAGKSSIFNSLVKEDRSIVSDIHGTTRDWIESWTSFSSIPVRLYDTAGLRETTDKIELIGLERTNTLVKEADIILYVIDGSQGITKEDSHFLQQFEEIKDKQIQSCIKIWNKADKTKSKDIPSDWIPLCAKTGLGISDLTDKISEILKSQSNSTSETSVAVGSLRQKEVLLEAAKYAEDALLHSNEHEPLDMIAQDLLEATDALGEITGETVPEDILRKVFSQFCVGK